MIALIVMLAAAFVLFRLLGGAPVLIRRSARPEGESGAKIEELTEYASRLRSSKRYTSAEKVYLQILKIDHRHASTYSRLGTLYVTMKNTSDAIECFEIATQLSPNALTFYNLGLAYYENKNHMKAVAAFEKSIMFEPSVQRFVGLAKAFNRLGDGDKMISALEQAAQLEEHPKILWLLADAYEAAGRPEDQEATVAKIKEVAPRDERLKKERKLAKAA